MFEFDKYDREAAHQPASPKISYTPFEGGRKRALLLWGEHCIECAAPDCFVSCDLYQARPDRRCRRFRFGAFKNTAFQSSSGYGAEVIFKRWAKLEARGNALLLRNEVVGLLERGIELLAPITNRIGTAGAKLLGDIRWSYLTHSLLERMNASLHRRHSPHDLPDAFVIEIYNPGTADVVLMLTMGIDRTKLTPGITAADLPRPVVAKLTLPPGYFREDIARETYAELIGSGLPFNLALTPEADEGTHLIFLSLDFVSYAQAAGGLTAKHQQRVKRPPAKCVIFDLDNTLWDGVLLEGDVTLRPAVTNVIRQLDERGILISIASKNAHDDAMERLRVFGLDQYALYPAIGWSAKSESVRQVAERLGLGLDSVIFVDDSPFERDEVSRSLPEVDVLPDSAIPTLPEHPRLQGSVTEESKRRRLMYRQSMERQTAEAALGSDYMEFLASCDIRVDIRPSEPEDFDRVAELVQRTNQLNFSGRKYQRTELEEIMLDRTAERHVIDCSDRYGSYGTVGFCLARRVDDGIRIEDLMLSCRIQGKFIENALLHHLCTRPEWCASFVEIVFNPTDRNAAAGSVLRQLGFAPAEPDLLRTDAVPGQFHPKFMTIVGTHGIQRVFWGKQIG
ncbi:HAD-IIIC family phosphatase [Sphingosinicella humi]|nr:HAD-IIIC family phosphatase [Sphingosinicella humi]